jgi:hypothetical protein
MTGEKISSTRCLPLSCARDLPTFSNDRTKLPPRLRVARVHRRLTPSQPKFDITENDRIAPNVPIGRVCVALRCVREFVDVSIA